MTEKEIAATLELVVQKAERLYDAICELDEAETAYKANWDVEVGSESWLRANHAMLRARQAVRHDKIILAASLREAKDTLSRKAAA